MPSHLIHSVGNVEESLQVDISSAAVYIYIGLVVTLESSQWTGRKQVVLDQTESWQVKLNI